MTYIFHSTESLDSIPIIRPSYPFTVLFKHPDIKRDIMSNDMIGFIDICEKMIYIAIDVSIVRNHGCIDTMDSLSKKIYLGSYIDILIYPHLLMEYFSIESTIKSGKLENLISRRKSGSFRIDKKQWNSFLIFWHKLENDK